MGQYTKYVQFNGDPNPNGDNYIWEDVNGALGAGWVSLNDNQQAGEAVFTVNQWLNNPTGSRSATFRVKHHLYDPSNPIGSLVDDFTITQYADGAVEVTTQATAATTQATQATTTSGSGSGSGQTSATTQQQYTVTITANSNIANAQVYNVASGGSPNNVITRTGVDGQGIGDAFYIEADSGYNISPSQVSVGLWTGGGSNYYVDNNVNSAGRVVVGFNDSLDPNNLNLTIGIAGTVSQLTYTAQIYQTNNTSAVCNGTSGNVEVQYPQGQGGANFRNYIQNELQIQQGATTSFKVISSNEPSFAWGGWAITLNDQNEGLNGGWFDCSTQTTTQATSGSGSGSGQTTTSGSGSGQTTVIPSSVTISGSEWIYTMGGPEDYGANVTNIQNPIYTWSLSGQNVSKFVLSNENQQTCTLEYIWTSQCDGGGQNVTLNVTATGTNSQGQSVIKAGSKTVNGCDDSSEGGSS